MVDKIYANSEFQTHLIRQHFLADLHRWIKIIETHVISTKIHFLDWKCVSVNPIDICSEKEMYASKGKY